MIGNTAPQFLMRLLWVVFVARFHIVGRYRYARQGVCARKMLMGILKDAHFMKCVFLLKMFYGGCSICLYAVQSFSSVLPFNIYNIRWNADFKEVICKLMLKTAYFVNFFFKIFC